MSTEQDYYQLLGIPRRATREQIQHAYHEVARVYHPDSNFYDEILGSAGGGATVQIEDEKFKHLTNAYNTLMNDQRRREYDATLAPELRGWDDADQSIGRAEVLARVHGESPRSISGAFGRFGSIDKSRSADPIDTKEDAEQPSVLNQWLRRCGL